MDASAKKARGIKRYHAEIRRIAEMRGCTPKEAKAIYKNNGQVEQTEHAENGGIPGIITEMMRMMATLEANPAVAEYRRILTAHAALTEHSEGACASK